jgi:hypothetical protein
VQQVASAAAAVRQQLAATEQKEAEQAWQAWLGYYNGQLRKLNLTKEQLVGKSAEYAATLGLPQIPALQKKTIGKMGLQVRSRSRLYVSWLCVVGLVLPVSVFVVFRTVSRLPLRSLPPSCVDTSHGQLHATRTN